MSLMPIPSGNSPAVRDLLLNKLFHEDELQGTLPKMVDAMLTERQAKTGVIQMNTAERAAELIDRLESNASPNAQKLADIVQQILRNAVNA